MRVSEFLSGSLVCCSISVWPKNVSDKEEARGTSWIWLLLRGFSLEDAGLMGDLRRFRL